MQSGILPWFVGAGFAKGVIREDSKRKGVKEGDSLTHCAGKCVVSSSAMHLNVAPEHCGKDLASLLSRQKASGSSWTVRHFEVVHHLHIRTHNQ